MEALLWLVVSPTSVVGIVLMRLQNVLKYELFDFSRFVSVQWPERSLTTVAETSRCMFWRGVVWANRNLKRGHYGAVMHEIASRHLSVRPAMCAVTRKNYLWRIDWPMPPVHSTNLTCVPSKGRRSVLHLHTGWHRKTVPHAVANCDVRGRGNKMWGSVVALQIIRIGQLV